METVGGAQAKKRSVGGEVAARRPRQSASSRAMLVAPSVGSVTSSRQTPFMAERSPPRRPAEIRLAGGSGLIETTDRRGHRRIVDHAGIVLGLLRDLDHRLAERVQGVLGFGLGRLD